MLLYVESNSMIKLIRVAWQLLEFGPPDERGRIMGRSGDDDFQGSEITEQVKFGDVLKQVRELRGISQRELARLVGVNSAYVSRIEANIVPPSEEVLARMVEALDTRELYWAAGRMDPEIWKRVWQASRKVPAEPHEPMVRERHLPWGTPNPELEENPEQGKLDGRLYMAPEGLKDRALRALEKCAVEKPGINYHKNVVLETTRSLEPLKRKQVKDSILKLNMHDKDRAYHIGRFEGILEAATWLYGLEPGELGNLLEKISCVGKPKAEMLAFLATLSIEELDIVVSFAKFRQQWKQERGDADSKHWYKNDRKVRANT